MFLSVLSGTRVEGPPLPMRISDALISLSGLLPEWYSTVSRGGSIVYFNIGAVPLSLMSPFTCFGGSMWGIPVASVLGFSMFGFGVVFLCVRGVGLFVFISPGSGCFSLINSKSSGGCFPEVLLWCSSGIRAFGVSGLSLLFRVSYGSFVAGSVPRSTVQSLPDSVLSVMSGEVLRLKLMDTGAVTSGGPTLSVTYASRAQEWLLRSLTCHFGSLIVLSLSGLGVPFLSFV